MECASVGLLIHILASGFYALKHVVSEMIEVVPPYSIHKR
jgi:hypothetical protein